MDDIVSYDVILREKFRLQTGVKKNCLHVEIMHKNTRSTRVWGPGVVNLDIPIYFKISLDMLILTETKNKIEIFPLKARPYLAIAVSFFNTKIFAELQVRSATEFSFNI